jgi:protein TonB
MAGQRLRSHLSGSVPVSIVVHLVLLFVLVVIPLLNVVIPIPALMMPSYVLAAPLPPPPPAVVRRPSAPPAAADAAPSSVPIKAPDRLAPEPPAAPAVAAIGNIDDGGVPSGLGIEGPLTPPATPAAPLPPPQPTQVRAAQLPVLPRKIVDVHPLYPDVARVAHIEGTVTLEAVLDTNGRVTQLRVLNSVPLLDQAALDAVRQWRYTPSSYYGRPVSVLMTITVRFTLQS